MRFTILSVLIILLYFLTGCQQKLTDKEIVRLYEEAIAENQKLRAQYQPANEQWAITIAGQSQSAQAIQMNWSELQSLATARLRTQLPPPSPGGNTVYEFRGVPVRTLLQRTGLKPGVQSVTFVAYDGYRAVVPVTDLERYSILLATERDQNPIPRADGGPLYLVFPFTDVPEIRNRYPGSRWVFYVTHLILGNEPLKLRMDDRIFNEREFERLPRTTLNTLVGYRLYWPSTRTPLHGVLLQDVLQATGKTLAFGSEVLIRGKAPIHRDPRKPIRLSVSDLWACQVVLANRWGNKRELIPTYMGGPLVLAFAPDCESKLKKPLPWITFVEELEVLAP
ncbi:MAG: molybdopterin-dependent oxidoreductase [Leptolyngbyaceae cyanobacterium bins.59]|nr:molybdopterin-dependent oxidoreductase [Leptolyngbyaceae cyanobacterium bins.59]